MSGDNANRKEKNMNAGNTEGKLETRKDLKQQFPFLLFS